MLDQRQRSSEMGYGVISIYGRVVNKDALCLNTFCRSLMEVGREIIEFDVLEAKFTSDFIFLGLTLVNRYQKRAAQAIFRWCGWFGVCFNS